MTIIKMKKHPIDDIFAKKLAEHRQEPSQRALEKFQERLAQREEKRRGGMVINFRRWGYYAAAASVIVALTVGVLSQKNERENFATNEVKPNKKSQNIDNQSIENQIVANKVNKINPIESQTEKKEKVFVNDFSEKASIAKTEIPVLKEEKAIFNEDNSTEIASTEQPTNNIFSETPITETISPIQPKQEGIFKQDIGESIVVVFDTIEEKVNIPEISEDSSVDMATAEKLGKQKAEEEKSFLSKLFTEYKHLKYGEKVDLANLGINKKEVLARVDERFFKDEREEAKELVQRRFGKIRKIQD